jgi:hypothetical protein
MISQIIDTPQSLGIPLACFPKFKIGDLVQYSEDNSVYAIGTITSILIYESEIGNPNSITVAYSFFVLESNRAYEIGHDSDTYDESELTVVTVAVSLRHNLRQSYRLRQSQRT